MNSPTIYLSVSFFSSLVTFCICTFGSFFQPLLLVKNKSKFNDVSFQITHRIDPNQRRLAIFASSQALLQWYSLDFHHNSMHIIVKHLANTMSNILHAHTKHSNKTDCMNHLTNILPNQIPSAVVFCQNPLMVVLEKKFPLVPIQEQVQV